MRAPASGVPPEHKKMFSQKSASEVPFLERLDAAKGIVYLNKGRLGCIFFVYD